MEQSKARARVESRESSGYWYEDEESHEEISDEEGLDARYEDGNDENMKKLARLLRDSAYVEGSGDNISVLAMQFGDHSEACSE